MEVFQTLVEAAAFFCYAETTVNCLSPHLRFRREFFVRQDRSAQTVPRYGKLA